LKKDLDLEINEEKTKLTYVLRQKVHFLGVSIKMTFVQNISYKRSKYIERFRRLRLQT